MFEKLPTETLEKMQSYLTARISDEVNKKQEPLPVLFEDLGRVAFAILKRHVKEIQDE